MEDRSSGPVAFSAAVENGGEVTIVRLGGDLDMEGAGRLQQLLERVPDDRLVIDLRGLGFLDSMGLGVLLKAARSGRQEVRFVRGPTNVQRVFEITRTDVVLEWTEPPD